MTLFLGPADLERLHAAGHVGIDDYIAAVEGGFAEHGRGAIGVLPRAVIPADPTATTTRTRSLKLSASYLRESRRIGISSYTALFRPGEVDMWLSLFSGDTGRMLAIVNGKSVSVWKTAATAAVATKHLAPADTTSAALIGTGRYAFHQALALAAARRLSRLACFSRDRDRASAFAARVREALPALDVSVAPSIAAALAEATIVTTITTATTPIVAGHALRPGMHLNVLGAHDPGERELDTAAVVRSRVFVDALEQALGEKGELMLPLAAGAIGRSHIVAELGAVVAGRTPGRRDPAEITMFLSGGTALEYTPILAMLVDRARAAGIGTPLPTES